MNSSTELTDEQILASLISRRDKLNIQLNKIMVAIKAFEGDNKIDDNFDKSDNREVNQSNTTVKQYSDLVTFTEKILFYVKVTDGGYVKDIVQYIMRNEPNKYGEDYLHHRVTQTASNLYGKKRLDADKIGRRFFYKDKKAD